MPLPRNCALESLVIDFAPPGDPRAWAGSSDTRHDQRQALVSPPPRPPHVRREYIPNAVWECALFDYPLGVLRRRRSCPPTVTSRPVSGNSRGSPRPMSPSSSADEIPPASLIQRDSRRSSSLGPSLGRPRVFARPARPSKQDRHLPSDNSAPVLYKPLTTLNPAQLQTLQMHKHEKSLHSSMTNTKYSQMAVILRRWANDVLGPLTRTGALPCQAQPTHPPQSTSSFGLQTAHIHLAIRQRILSWNRLLRRLQGSRGTPLLPLRNQLIRDPRLVAEQSPNSSLRSFGGDPMDMRINPAMLPTRRAQPNIRGQTVGSPSHNAPRCFPRRPMFNRSNSEMDALALAAGRLRLGPQREQVEPTTHQEHLADLGQEGETIQTAILAVRRAVSRVELALQETLRRMGAAPEKYEEDGDHDGSGGGAEE